MEYLNLEPNAPAWTVVFFQQKIKAELYSLPKTSVIRRPSGEDSPSTARTIMSSVSQLRHESLPRELSSSAAKGKKRARSPGGDGSAAYLEPYKKQSRTCGANQRIYYHSGKVAVEKPTKIDPQQDLPLGTTYIHEIEKHNTEYPKKQCPEVQIWIRCKGGNGKLEWKRCRREEDVRLPDFEDLRLSINERRTPGWVLRGTAQRKSNSYRLVASLPEAE